MRSILSELYSVLNDDDNDFYLLLKECFVEDQKFRDFELKTFTLSRVETYDNKHVRDELFEKATQIEKVDIIGMYEDTVN